MVIEHRDDDERSVDTDSDIELLDGISISSEHSTTEEDETAELCSNSSLMPAPSIGEALDEAEISSSIQPPSSLHHSTISLEQKGSMRFESPHYLLFRFLPSKHKPLGAPADTDK